MLGTRKTVTKKENELVENIKRDIQEQLVQKGITLSGFDMEINPENISLCISLNGSRRLI